jgi:tyrosyl-tRNA synthetase
MQKFEIELLLSRGVEEVHIRENLEKRLLSGEKLRVKFGIDPTGTDLHLGHMVPLKKLAEFQKFEHQVVLLFGTFTARIGDPTGKSKTRPVLSPEQISLNMKTYLDQAGKILDLEKVEVVQNHEWFEPMGFNEILKLASSFTVSQMLHRDMYQERLKKNEEISLHEFFYPLLQGYDSVELKADVEIGGTDQLFNLMAGRTIQKFYGLPQQDVLTVPILEGTDGKEKMSKSLGNFIGITESPREIFGKTMSIPDSLMEKYFSLLTDFSSEEISKILSGHPKDAKILLAKTLVKIFHDQKAAENAQEEFVRIFSERSQNAVPDDIQEIKIPTGDHSVLEIALQSNLFASNSDARRMIQEGGVKIDGKKKDKLDENISLQKGGMFIFQAGKRKFCKFIVSESNKESFGKIYSNIMKK